MKLSPLAMFVVLAAVSDARRFGGGGRAIQTSTTAANSGSVHRLHKVLNIGNDPREAIWTNRALNMEGL